MATMSEFADSTDWLPTPLSALAPLESSLRCQVCKDFFTTPMITSCSHTFCSLCIRRYLSQEGKCPACREQDQEIKLRRNWVVEELVANFTQSRAGLLEFAQEAGAASRVDEQIGRPKKRRKVAVESRTNGAERRSTRSQARHAASQASIPSTQSEIAASEDEGSVYDDELPTSRPAPDQHSVQHDDGLISCPSCSRRMKENLINTHLDRCLAGKATPPASSPTPPQIKAGTIAYNQTKPSANTTRLPTINYGLLNENKMRTKLKELGIPNHGSKELMRKRHIEWVNLWNANCDSLNQVGKKDLLRQLDTWERTMGKQIERNAGPNGVMVKDFDREGYMQKEKSEFDALIARARAMSKKVAAAKAEDKPSLPEDALQPVAVEAVRVDDIDGENRSEQPYIDRIGHEPAKNLEAPTKNLLLSSHDQEPVVIEESPVKAMPIASQEPGYPSDVPYS